MLFLIGEVESVCTEEWKIDENQLKFPCPRKIQHLEIAKMHFCEQGSEFDQQPINHREFEPIRGLQGFVPFSGSKRGRLVRV